jgi:Cu/Ag efflux protein CusF
VLGIVTKVTQDSVTVEQRNKTSVTVVILPTTMFTKNTAPAKLADVKTGDRIAINAVETNGKLVAESVRFISAKPAQVSAAPAKPAAK